MMCLGKKDIRKQIRPPANAMAIRTRLDGWVLSQGLIVEETSQEEVAVPTQRECQYWLLEGRPV